MSAVWDEGREPEAPGWRFWRSSVPAPLAPYVVAISGYVEHGCNPILRAEFPSCVVPLIIVLDDAFVLHQTNGHEVRRRLDRTFLAGLHRRPAVIGSEGSAACIEVDLTPLGARRLLRTELIELSGLVASLSALAPHLETALVDALAQATDWQGRFRCVERFLCRHILHDDRDDPRIATACLLLQSSDGPPSIARLSKMLGVSRKHLNALFKTQIGCTPKAFSRIARFSRAVHRLQQASSPSDVALADLAAWCGYADQSHFNRDFKAFAGASPTDILARTLPGEGGVSAVGT